MKVSFQPNFYTMKLKNSDNESKIQNSAQSGISPNNSTNNISFKGPFATTLLSIVGVSAFSTLATLGYFLIRQNNTDEENLNTGNPNFTDTKDEIKTPTSDIRNMGIDDLEGIRIIEAADSEEDLPGYIAFMYEGKPYTTTFEYQNKNSVKMAILDKLIEIDSRNAYKYKSKRLCLEESSIAVNDIGNVHPEINNKICILQTASRDRLGYAAFMYNGNPHIISFSNNTINDVETAYKQFLSQLAA